MKLNLFVILCFTVVIYVQLFRPAPFSPSQGENYYHHEDPVFKDKNSEWYGVQASEYGLLGKPCERHLFVNLISGNDLQGNQVIKDGARLKDKSLKFENKRELTKDDFEKHHRAGIDIPFSCPKSISVLALHVGLKTLITLHDEAVKATLDYIEKNYIYIRETKRGTTLVRNTGKMICALFRHSTSRANDPQVHTHALIINHVRIPEKNKPGEYQYRSVWFDEIFKNQVLINNVYQNELAKRVRQFGYEITCDGKGKWEIAGLSKEIIAKYSKRSAAIDPAQKKIEDKNKYLDAHPAAIRNMATKDSRPPKDRTIDEKQLKEQWEKEFPASLIKQALETYQNRKFPVIELNPKEVIRLAYHSIHETECLFTRTQIFQRALQLGIGHITMPDIEKAFLEMRALEEIQEVSRYVSRKGIVTHHYTSERMKKIEWDVLNAFQQGLNQSAPLLPYKAAETVIRKRYEHLTSDQRNMLMHLLSSRNQFMLIQGDAGTGKTSAIESLREILQEKAPNMEVIGLGYTGKAAEELQKTGIESQTISRFLNKTENLSSAGRFIICDESSMLGSLQAEELFATVKKEGARLVLVGDGKQLQALSAGRLFRDLQNANVPYIEMTQILRQKNELAQRAVMHIKDYMTGKNLLGIHESFSLLKKNDGLNEIRDRNELLNAVKETYLKSADPEQVMLITPSNKDRMELNRIIRSELKETGRIDGKDVQISVAVPTQLPGIAPYFASSYTIGQSVFVHQHNRVTGEKAWFDAMIVGINPELNSLVVMAPDNDIRQISLRDKTVINRISLYDRQKRDFAVGDAIGFLKNDKALGVQNGQTGKVVRIDKKGIFHIQRKDTERRLIIDPVTYPWLDHAYAVSIHKSQGSTASAVILLADTRHEKLNKTESLYVALSRAENHINVFTDNERLLRKQYQSGQEKTSTLVPDRRIESQSKTNTIDREVER